MAKSNYSELEKMNNVKGKSQTIREFFDWLFEKYTNVHSSINIEKLLAEYFEIDLNKVEKEKQELIENIRRQLPY